jgi:hypothetical protein
MRAHEFITEGRGGTRSTAPHEFEVAHPGLVGPGGNGDVYWGRYYDFYRVNTLAGMDIKDIEKLDTIGFFGNLPTFSAYTEPDKEKLMLIMKKLGMKPKEYIAKGSLEPNGTNIQSPVKSFKGYE